MEWGFQRNGLQRSLGSVTTITKEIHMSRHTEMKKGGLGTSHRGNSDPKGTAPTITNATFNSKPLEAA